MSYKRKTSHSRYDCTYHLIWITKYRYKLLIGDIGIRIRDILRQICIENDVEIIRGTVSNDHVHMYVSAPPTYQ